MPTTTSNLLAVVNRVMENVGERQVTSLTTPLGKLVYDCLVSACYEVSLMNEWTFLKLFLPAQSWTNEVAYLGDNIQAVHNVVSGDTATGFRPLRFLPSDMFNTRPLFAADDTMLYSWRDYMLTDFNKVRFNPYPTGSIGQSQILFDVSTSIVPPSNPTDFFPFPERFLFIVIAKATALVLLRHLGDAGTAQVEDARFMKLASQMMQRERGTVAGKQSMYKPLRGNYPRR